MRIGSIAVIISLLVTISAMAASGEVLVDRIVAVVDGYPVLHSEVMEKVKIGPLVVVSEYPADDKSTSYDKALQDAVNFELVMQMAEELDLDVTTDEVDHEIDGFLEQRGLTREGLLSFLGQQGQSYDDYKRDFRNQMILRKFQGRVIQPAIKVTDRDIETYYLMKSGTTAELVELTLRQIFIRVDADAAGEVVEAKESLAKEVYQKLVGGMDFVEAVKLFSDDSAARSTGGLMAGIRLKDLAGQIRTDIEALSVEEFTAPVRTAVGFHIFLLVEKKFSGSSDFVKQKQRLEFELRNVELATQTRKWLAEQRQKSKVEILPH